MNIWAWANLNASFLICSNGIISRKKVIYLALLSTLIYTQKKHLSTIFIANIKNKKRYLWLSLPFKLQHIHMLIYIYIYIYIYTHRATIHVHSWAVEKAKQGQLFLVILMRVNAPYIKGFLFSNKCIVSCD